MIVLLYIIVFIFSAFIFFLFYKHIVLNIEKTIRHIKRKAPLHPSDTVLRNATVSEIKKHYSWAKTACDIGSGHGGLARKIARECSMRVTALENMFSPALFSKISDIPMCGKSKTLWVDAFKYLEKSDGFDLAVAYLGPETMDQLLLHRNKFRVLITLDFPIKRVRAKRIITMPNGYTRYGNKKYPHKLFVYEF